MHRTCKMGARKIVGPSIDGRTLDCGAVDSLCCSTRPRCALVAHYSSSWPILWCWEFPKARASSRVRAPQRRPRQCLLGITQASPSGMNVGRASRAARTARPSRRRERPDREERTRRLRRAPQQLSTVASPFCWSQGSLDEIAHAYAVEADTVVRRTIRELETRNGPR